MLMTNLIARITRVLLDETKVRWTESELVDWINDGAIEIVRRDPSANPFTASVDLAEGADQLLPSDLLSLGRFIAIVDGSDIYAAPLPTTQEHLDMLVPGWRGFNAVAPGDIDFVCYNPANRLSFEVFPPSSGVGTMRVLYGKKPSVAVSGENVPVPDQYCPALVDYALYRAFSKDDPASEDSSADKAFQRFLANF